jgi:hypothetical protein
MSETKFHTHNARQLRHFNLLSHLLCFPPWFSSFFIFLLSSFTLIFPYFLSFLVSLSLHNEEFRTLCTSPNTITTKKSRRMRRAERTTRIAYVRHIHTTGQQTSVFALSTLKWPLSALALQQVTFEATMGPFSGQ